METIYGSTSALVSAVLSTGVFSPSTFANFSDVTFTSRIPGNGDDPPVTPVTLVTLRSVVSCPECDSIVFEVADRLESRTCLKLENVDDTEESGACRIPGNAGADAGSCGRIILFDPDSADKFDFKSLRMVLICLC